MTLALSTRIDTTHLRPECEWVTRRFVSEHLNTDEEVRILIEDLRPALALVLRKALNRGITVGRTEILSLIQKTMAQTSDTVSFTGKVENQSSPDVTRASMGSVKPRMLEFIKDSLKGATEF